MSKEEQDAELIELVGISIRAGERVCPIPGERGIIYAPCMKEACAVWVGGHCGLIYERGKQNE